MRDRFNHLDSFRLTSIRSDLSKGSFAWRSAGSNGLSEEFILDLFIQICEAVSIFHFSRPSLAHRDIKVNAHLTFEHYETLELAAKLMNARQTMIELALNGDGHNNAQSLTRLFFSPRTFCSIKEGMSPRQ